MEDKLQMLLKGLRFCPNVLPRTGWISII